MSDFDQLVTDDTPQYFNEAATDPSPTNTPANDVTARLAALSTENPIFAVQENTIATMKQRLADGQEMGIRLDVAAKRQERQMQAFEKNRQFLDKLGGGVTPETASYTDTVYGELSQQKVEDNARASIEREAIDRIQDDLSSGNSVEAKLSYDLMFGKGSATKIWYDNAAKNLILAQKAQQYESEATDDYFTVKGQAKAVFNTITEWLPFNDNFAKAGVVDDGTKGVRNFLLSGTGLQSQGEAFMKKFREQTPEEFATSMSDVGEIGASIRSNATTWGVSNPNTASSILAGLSYQNASDRAWANAWSLSNVALTLPWGKAATIPGVLMRAGSRSSARSAVVAAAESVMANGPKAAAESTGIKLDEVIGHLETSAMNPSKSPSEITLSADVSSGLEAVARAKTEIPAQLQTSTFTNAAELLDAQHAALKRIEEETGRTIKDVKYVYEDVATGSVVEYKAGQLPEQGNVVHKVEVTFGKKGGGGFATAKTAVSEARTKLGIRAEAVKVETETLKRVPDPDYNITGYHGTAKMFDKHDMALGGELTQAKSAKEAVFYTNNPDVAWTYAIQAARDNALSLPEMQAASKAHRDAMREFADVKNELGDRYGHTKDDGFGLAAFMQDDEYRHSDLDRSFLFDEGASDEDLALFDNASRKQADASNNFYAARDETSASGQNIRPAAIRMRNPYVHDYADQLANGYDEQAYSAIIAKAKADGHDGVIFKNTNDGMGFSPEMGDMDQARQAAFDSHDIYAVFDPEDVKPPFDAYTVERDVSGQFFAKATFNVEADGFRTTPLNTPNNLIISGARSDARRLDRDTQMKAVAAGMSSNKLIEASQADLKAALKGVGARDRLWLDEIVRKGQNSSTWYSEAQFNQIFERATGKLPSEKTLRAYQSYRFANDVDFSVRNDEIYKTLANKGFENVEMNVPGGAINGNAKVRIGGNRPTERVYNATDNVSFGPNNPLTDEEFKRLTGEGYLVVELQEAHKFPDGLTLRTMLAKRSDLERSALRREQLAYKAGGHRAYTGRYYLKQAVEGVQPDNGGSYLMNPNVIRTGNNPNVLRKFSERFNKAIDDAVEGNMDPQHYDDNIFANDDNLVFPSGEEFLEAFNNGLIDKKHRFEVVGDREMPSAYSKGRDDVERFVDADETSSGGYYRSTGRMYTSSRGDHLLDASGEFAETVDPWETTNTALGNISRLTSFNNYKENIYERFKNTYADYLKLRQLENASPSEMITAEIRDDVPSALARKIKAEQAGVARILNFETGWEKNVRHATRELSEWVVGDATGGAREKAGDFVYWLSKNNPVNALRGFAFDAKLGLFNAGQLLLQTSTIGVSVALSPVHGYKGFKSMIPLFTYANMKGNEAVLDTLAKNGAWKLGGFADEAEFKDFSRFVYRSGFLDVNSNHLSINDLNPHKRFGAAGAVDGVREAGRVFFYKAEQFNRSVAARIAWEEAKERGLQVGSSEFREAFTGLADDYSMNMTQQSSAAFQKGPLSIPTQFWGYNIRLMDAMLGNRFTGAQKARLITSQLLLYGAAGVPVADALGEYYQMKTGEPAETGSFESIVERGAVDNALAAITGADVSVGKRFGVNTSFMKDIFGMSEYGEKSPLEIAGGATFSISKDTGKTLYDAVRYTYAESGGDQGYPLTRDSLLRLASNVSSVSNTLKALMVFNYGVYKSNKGTVQVSDLPSVDAYAVALGIAPAEVDKAGLMYQYTKDRKDVISEASKQVRNWRQEAFTNPDMLEENSRKVNAFMQQLPADIRPEVLKQTNKITDESFYEHVANKYHEERLKETAYGESE